MVRTAAVWFTHLLLNLMKLRDLSSIGAKLKTKYMKNNSQISSTVTCGKSSISAVWQGFELIFVLIIFTKLFPICVLNLVNIFHHTSILCMVKSMWPQVQHICLIMKIIIVFLNHGFLKTVMRIHPKSCCIFLLKATTTLLMVQRRAPLVYSNHIVKVGFEATH